MKNAAKITDLVRAHKAPPAGMMFYTSLESTRDDVGLLGYASVIERAWLKMKLNGVLCLNNRPVLYFKEHGRTFSSLERILLQKLFWNQGVANVLVLADPTHVNIYSGLAKPVRDHRDREAMENALVETFVQADYVQRIQSLYHDLATGHYYEAHQSHFDPNQAVDSWLLDNLRALRDALIEGEDSLDAKVAHAFIGRILFLCYLLDRGIISLGKTGRGDTGTMLLCKRLTRDSSGSGIDFLYDLFGDLKVRFNGNMFDQNLDAEKRLIRPLHVKALTFFLGGRHVKSGQRTMGFWPYDFKMIPVETISAIYQDFLGTEDRVKQKKRGAFYTPRFLAEMVVDVAVDVTPDGYDRSFLDPACGSGIFLVILFNRLATRRLHAGAAKTSYVAKAKALQEILARQIRGVDVEETACRIACFSLYLAYLDFFNPPDIKNYLKKTGQPLPKLLNYGDAPNRPDADIPVIHMADSLSDGTLSGAAFDCIIGNPPWEGRGSKQLAQKFMQTAPRFLRAGGAGCLLLPSKILQNRTDDFQAEWLIRVTLEKVVQLADFRRLLFQNAKTPAFIARFKNTPPRPAEHKVEFTAPKFNRDGLRQGVVTVNPSARAWIPLSDILAGARSGNAPVVWKRRLWGTPRDQKLLDLLQSLSPLSDIAGAPGEGKCWIKGQGFQPNTSGKSTNPKLPWWEKSHLYIGAKASCWGSNCIQIRSDDCAEIGNRFSSLHRLRDKRIYRGPMVLISQGLSKVAYCDFDALFQDSLQSIAGPREDAELLMFLAAYLRSDLAKYFLFHTAANWGSERNKVHLGELLRIPFPLPGDDFISPDAGRIVKQTADKIVELRNELNDTLVNLKADARRYSLFEGEEADISNQWRDERKRRVDALQEDLEPLIHRYFGLTEQEITLVEDTIRVFEPSSTPSTWRSRRTVSLDPVENARVEPYAAQGLRAYADALTKTLNAWAEAEGSTHRVRAEGGTDHQTGLAIVSLSLTRTETAYQPMELSKNLTEIVKEFHAHASKRRGALLYERDILLFQKERIHIVRPNILLNWTRTAAFNDAARIYGEIAIAEEES